MYNIVYTSPDDRHLRGLEVSWLRVQLFSGYVVSGVIAPEYASVSRRSCGIVENTLIARERRS